MSLHTIRIEQGVVSSPAQPNQNPSVAESPTQAKGQSPVGLAITTGTYIQAAKQIRDGVIGEIGAATGNYELQEKAETLVEVGALLVGFTAAPVVTGIALTIKTGFDIYRMNRTQTRNAYKQQQQQVLTGKIATNGGVWV